MTIIDWLIVIVPTFIIGWVAYTTRPSNAMTATTAWWWLATTILTKNEKRG